MDIASHVAASGTDTVSTTLAVIAHNLANQDSTAFNGPQAVQTNRLYHDLAAGGGPVGAEALNIPSRQVGSGVRTAAVLRNMRQGLPIATNNPFDVYINGAGYLRIELGNGLYAYTRAGNLKLDRDGTLRTATDYALADNITIDMTLYNTIIIDKSGRLFGVDPTQEGESRYQELGRLTLWNFRNPQGLEAREDTLFIEGANSGTPLQGTPGLNGLGIIQQGFAEKSNVEASKELVKAIDAQRKGETCAQMMELSTKNQKDTLSHIGNTI